MRKKVAALLLGGAFLLAVSGNVQAMTGCVDLGSTGEEQGSVIWYFTGDRGYTIDSETESIVGDEAEPQMQYEYDSGTMIEYGDFSEIKGLSEEEKKKLENWHREEMREQIAYLEVYGVTYDGEADKIMYRGKTVRWLIDRQIDNTCMAIQMPEGEIDLYTVRSEDFKLTGVRIATKEEYEERTEKEMQSGKLLAVAEDSGQYRESSCVETAVVQDAEEDVQVQSADGLTEGICEATAAEARPETKEEREEWERKVREYENAGIGYDKKSGCWLWQKQPIYFLADENGSLYQNGSDEALRNRIYVIVKRNSDGSIKETKQATMEEVVEKKMLMDR